jgi:Domain of unknown function (DUF1918)
MRCRDTSGLNDGEFGTFGLVRALDGCFDLHEGTEARRTVVKAEVGDKIVVKGHHVGEPERDAVVVEVRGPDGQPPYLVRWADDGHEGLFFPGTDATIVHHDDAEQP